MCNLYSVTKGQQAIRELAGVMRDRTGNLPLMPGIYPDYRAPVVRNQPAACPPVKTGNCAAKARL